MINLQKKVFKKEIFLTGEYVQYFKPEDYRNPFTKIYDRKKQDTLNIIKKLKTKNNILDVGGGMGRLSIALAKTIQNMIVLSDISTYMLKLTLDKAGGLENLKVINADAHQLPYQNDSFDLVVGLDLFCHLEKPEKALVEFNRVLKPGGILIIDSTNSNPLWALFYPRYLGKNPMNWWRTIKFSGVLPGWQHIVKHYSKQYFLSVLNKFGFEVIRCHNYGPIVCPKWHMAISKKII